MKKTIFTILLLFTYVNSYASLKVKVYENTQSVEMKNIYILGLVGGFLTANANLELRKQNPLFCMPPKLILSVEDYKNYVIKNY
jgi:hypothetical protein